MEPRNNSESHGELECVIRIREGMYILDLDHDLGILRGAKVGTGPFHHGRRRIRCVQPVTTFHEEGRGSSGSAPDIEHVRPFGQVETVNPLQRLPEAALDYDAS